MRIRIPVASSDTDPERRVKGQGSRVKNSADSSMLPGSEKKEAGQTKNREPDTGSRVILGIDPGSAVTGYGLIRSDERENVLLECGVIRTDSKRPLPEKLKEIFEGLSDIIQSKNPDQLAIEETFYSKNAKSALVMGQARGVAILAAACAKLPVSEYSPKEVKSSVVGQGSASKLQVQYMVKNLLGLKELPQPVDAADALAIALCHAQKLRLKTILITRSSGG
jgi:crossover junction endodeoxyribonuclease RuvC